MSEFPQKPHPGRRSLIKFAGASLLLSVTPVAKAALNRSAGVLAVRVNLAKFSEDMVTPVKVGQNGYAFIVDKAGVVFSHPDAGRILKFKLAEFDWGRKLLSMARGVVEYQMDGLAKAAVFTRDKNTGWTVAAHPNIAWSVTGGALRASVVSTGGYAYITRNGLALNNTNLTFEYYTRFMNGAKHGGAVYKGVVLYANPQQCGWSSRRSLRIRRVRWCGCMVARWACSPICWTATSPASSACCATANVSPTNPTRTTTWAPP